MGDAEQQATGRRRGLGVLQAHPWVKALCGNVVLQRVPEKDSGWCVKVAGHGEAVRSTTRSEKFLEELPITCSSVQPQKERLRCWSMPPIASRNTLTGLRHKISLLHGLAPHSLWRAFRDNAHGVRRALLQDVDDFRPPELGYGLVVSMTFLFAVTPVCSIWKRSQGTLLVATFSDGHSNKKLVSVLHTP